jgi:IclR family acetate operon transcriptional repressor
VEPNRQQPEPPPGLLQTADRALQVLFMFDDRHTELGVTDVAEIMGINKSMSQRLLATLAYRGFLLVDANSRKYRIGPAALTLGNTWKNSGSIQLIALPVMRQLSHRTGATVILAVPDHGHMRVVSAVDGDTGPLRIQPLIGEMYPAHAGATPKAYYAYLPPSQRQQLFVGRPVARFTPNTVTDIDSLEDEFHRIRSAGYASTVGEYDPHVACVAVPVFLHGAPYASLSIAGPVESFTDPEHHLPALRTASSQLERSLTGQNPGGVPLRTNEEGA